MDTMVTSQIIIFLFSMLLGAFLSLVFDGFRISNAVLKVNLKRIFFEDVIYFILSAIITFTYILVVNSGEIRVYIIFGEVLGWIIYRLTIGKFVYKIILTVVKFLSKWFSKLKKYVISKIPKDKIRKLIGKIKNKKPKFIKSSKPKRKFLQKIRGKIKSKTKVGMNKNICWNLNNTYDIIISCEFFERKYFRQKWK